MKTLKNIFGLMMAFLLTTSAFAQNTFGEIKGQVRDRATGETVPFAAVWIEIDEDRTRSTTTDIDGRFTLKPLQAGSYDVKFQMVGYTKKEIKGVIVKPDQIAWLKNITMDAGVDIGEFEVVEYENPIIRPEEPSKMVVLFEEIENNPGLRNPAQLVKNIVPGASSGGGEDNEIYFRGSRSDASGYYIDGVKLTGGLGNLPGSSIGSVTAYTGGVPAKYGDATGGIVVIETKSYFDLWRSWKRQEDEQARREAAEEAAKAAERESEVEYEEAEGGN